MKTMLLWSGGIESTSMLKYLLTETDDDVLAHHVVLMNPEGRAHIERRAIQSLGVLLAEVRPFEIVQSHVSIAGGAALGPDFAVVGPLAVVAARHARCERIVRGWCAEDEWERAQGIQPFKPNLPHSRYRDQAGRLQGLLQGHESAFKLFPEYPNHSWPKARHVQYLGDLLANYTWSCRRPQNGKECGLCHSCVERAAAFKGTSSIPAVAEKLRHG